MRIIIYGVGAVGGTIAVQLSSAGYEVLGIARGRQLEAVRQGGLTLHTPQGSRSAGFPVHEHPAEIGFRSGDVVFLTMKGQDTPDALMQLKSAGASGLPVFCFQNGVANEPLALRFFDDVYGATVMLPAEMNAPGEISAYFSPKPGGFDIGRFPSGIDGMARDVGHALETAGFIVTLREDVMASKYRKLLMNLRNIVEAAIGDETVRDEWSKRARIEAEGVLRAVGIAWDQTDSAARDILKVTDIEGRKSSGSSTFQSVARGTGSVETDYLNGEIVLLGRLHGIATPVNSAFCRLSTELASGRRKPRSAGDDTIHRLLAQERAP